MDVLAKKRVHIIGAGGIGISGLAKILAHRGATVSGSDAESSAVTDDLRARGMEISIGHSAANISEDVDVIIYSGAVPEDNVERAFAREKNISEYSYSEALGELTKEYTTIAVSGTHGKSTTTAMLGTILEAAGLDPLVLVGTKMATFADGNVRLGAGKIFVVEACEHNAQMMNLSPSYIVVTNLEPDHLDYYGTFDALCDRFRSYVSRVPVDHCIVNGDEAAVRGLFATDALPRTFGFTENTAVHCTKRTTEAGMQQATIVENDNQYSLKLRIPGAFNVMNALAAFSAARAVGVSAEVALDALYNFPGSWRRFERVGNLAHGAPVISDYGHHPTAIRETVAAAKEFFPGKRIVLAYQPHQHHRTKSLYPEFVAALASPEVLIMNEVYDVKGRERAEDSSVTSHEMMRDIEAARDGKTHVYAQSLDDVARLIQEHALPDDVVLVMGAGDIYKVAHQICSK